MSNILDYRNEHKGNVYKKVIFEFDIKAPNTIKIKATTRRGYPYEIIEKGKDDIDYVLNNIDNMIYGHLEYDIKTKKIKITSDKVLFKKSTSNNLYVFCFFKVKIDKKEDLEKYSWYYFLGIFNDMLKHMKFNNIYGKEGIMYIETEKYFYTYSNDGVFYEHDKNDPNVMKTFKKCWGILEIYSLQEKCNDKLLNLLEINLSGNFIN